ncbi:transcription antiterminator [Streptococcus chenjunshii]|uniref:Transcription antiterminator n=1 Tax=Streptococcus chenjunshii TaxID=2173853 RepID=A0A372KMN1_9STRE|nr:transcription antiterminator [Streptococcus chenjunshii]AXQ79566.1 transcription antiterminator [Streptococcus chenjunshii]RFU51481.1 transcription antiterminator [Streptococcus chenjunshii]RFU53537.1 transcription antiterminator [Streptococcus chenjunshii]
MIILDKKSYALLSYLLSLNEPETVMAISKKLNQSRRKIYYHLEKINEALPNGVEKIISYPRVGIVLNKEQKAACQELLEQLDEYSYVMSVEERIQLTLTYIAVSKKRVTIDQLMQLNAVSRNTILNDLNDIRHKLMTDEYDIQLQVTKARGYYLKCHPLSKIQFLYRLLYTIYTEGNKNFVDIVRDRIIDLTGFNSYFSDEVTAYLQQQLSSAQERLGKTLNAQDSQFMVQVLPYLLLSYRSIDLTDSEKEAVRRDFSMTWQRKEYQLAREIAAGLSAAFALQLDDVEISLIAMLLLSFRKDRDSHLESRDYDEMRAVLEEFLNQIQQRYGLEFENPDYLLNQLLTHCKAMLYRKTYGVLSVNPLTKHIKEKYSDLFAMTKACVPILEEAWLIRMTDDDIAYLTIHLGGELQRQDKIVQNQKRVVLVCDEGIGVQKLLLSQCRTHLHNCQIEAVLTSEQFHSVNDIMEADMVISTSDALDSRFPLIVVHPIMNDDDIIKLKRFVNNQGSQAESQFSQKLEKCLQAYISNKKDRYALKTQIEKIVGEELASLADLE